MEAKMADAVVRLDHLQLSVIVAAILASNSNAARSGSAIATHQTYIETLKVIQANGLTPSR